MTRDKKEFVETSKTGEMTNKDVHVILKVKDWLDTPDIKALYIGYGVDFNWGDSCADRCDIRDSIYIMAKCPDQYQEQADAVLLEVARLFSEQHILEKEHDLIFVLNQEP